MRVLLTGAPGFIGAAVARRLVREGCQVFAPVRPESNLWRIQDIVDSIQVLPCDLLDPDQVRGCLEKSQPEVCFHLAWYAEPGKYLTSPLNLRHLSASLKLAESLAENGCKRLVVAGSCAEYNSELGYLSENSPTAPGTLYAASKLALNLTLEKLAPQLDLQVSWGRIFYVYGPCEDERRFIPAVISSVLRGEATKLTPGGQVRDYLHIEDVASAMWAIAQKNLDGITNIGSGVPVTNREVAIKIGNILKRPELVRFGDLPYRPGDPMFVCADTRRLREQTGWQPGFDLEQGLINTIDWWKSQ
jgi:nucleoside-diphosphate-sugar epimerase